ncbi:hypothetical protein Aperf_G00000073170 [Anoplocephala perfoliata]
MPQCCFAGCHNRTDDGRGLSFFRFPRRDLARTAAWVVACGRKDFSPSQHSRVCSRHFSAVDFDRDARHDSNGGVHRRLRLKDTAVPTTNPVDNPWQNTDNMISRKSQKSVHNANAISPIAKLFLPKETRTPDNFRLIALFKFHGEVKISAYNYSGDSIRHPGSDLYMIH